MRSRGWLPAARRAAMVTTSCAVVDAVHRHRLTGVVPQGDPSDQRVQVELVVVQDHLARGQEVRSRPELTAAVGHHQRDHVVGVEIGGGVGDAGDAGRGDAAAQLGQVGLAPSQRLRPAAVGAAQPPVGVFGQADPAQRGGVEDPQRAAAVLNAHRNVRHDGVQRGPVQVAGHRLVIADGADPAVRTRGGVRKYLRQFVFGAHAGWSDAERVQRGGRRADMHMMVVQSGQHGAAARVEQSLAGSHGEVVAHLVDLLRRLECR